MTPISSTSSTTVCYFFFKDDNDEQSSASNTLCVILHQLFDARKQLIQHPLEEYCKKEKKFITEVKTLWNLILSTTAQKDSGTVFCILNGLDECQADSRKLLLDALVVFYSAQLREKAQQENRQLKFLMMSQPYPTIERRFCTLPEVRLKAKMRQLQSVET